MQKIVDLENTIGILKPYSNFESLIFSGKCKKKKKKKKTGKLEELCQNIYVKNQMFKV